MLVMNTEKDMIINIEKVKEITGIDIEDEE